MYIYYDLAIVIIYYIYLNKIIDKIINESELYKVYSKLKKEVHNNNYIVEKLFPIYNSLYKNDFDIIIEDIVEFQYIIEAIERKEELKERDNFINLDESIFNIDIKKLLNQTDDDELIYAITKIIAHKFICYRKNITLEDVFNVVIYEKRHLDIFNKVKEQQAIYEKERILNGDFDKEKEMNNELLDYSHIANGYDFEAYVANLYSLLGYKVLNLTSKSGDQGADIIIEKDSIKYAVQVKFYSSPVGNKAIQEGVAAKSYYKTHKAMVVTNSTYTKQAEELAKANDVILINGDKLEELKNEIANRNN